MRRKDMLRGYIMKGVVKIREDGICYPGNAPDPNTICGVWFEGRKKCSGMSSPCCFPICNNGRKLGEISTNEHRCGYSTQKLVAHILTETKVMKLLNLKRSIVYVTKW